MPDPNPYESPELHEPTRQRPGIRVATIVLLTMLALPAGGIAFFMTCLATGSMANNLSVGLLFGAVTGIATIVGVFYMGLASRKQATKDD